MDLVTWLSQYGWVGVFIWLLVERLLPFVKDAILPARAEERRQNQARIEKLEERQVVAVERIGEAVDSMAVLYATLSEQIRCVQDDQTVVRDYMNKLLEISKLHDLSKPTDRNKRRVTND